jgi:hypothetical protein
MRAGEACTVSAAQPWCWGRGEESARAADVAIPSARLAAQDGLLPCLQPHRLTVLAGTWNVNESRPAASSLRAWITPRAGDAHIVAVALQVGAGQDTLNDRERLKGWMLSCCISLLPGVCAGGVWRWDCVRGRGGACARATGDRCMCVVPHSSVWPQEMEMGTSSMAYDAARNLLYRSALVRSIEDQVKSVGLLAVACCGGAQLGRGLVADGSCAREGRVAAPSPIVSVPQERGNQNAQWWAAELAGALAAAGGSWDRVALRQMVGGDTATWQCDCRALA